MIVGSSPNPKPEVVCCSFLEHIQSVKIISVKMAYQNTKYYYDSSYTRYWRKNVTRSTKKPIMQARLNIFDLEWNYIRRGLNKSHRGGGEVKIFSSLHLEIIKCTHFFCLSAPDTIVSTVDERRTSTTIHNKLLLEKCTASSRIYSSFLSHFPHRRLP